MNKKEHKFDKLTENAKQVLANSYKIAKSLNSKSVNLEHVFISLLSLDRGLAARFLRSLGIDLKKTIESIEKKFIKKEEKKTTAIEVSNEVKELIKTAFILAHEFNHVYVGTEHILLAFLKLRHLDYVKELESAGFNFDTMKSKLFSYATYAPGIFIKDEKQKEEALDAISYFGKSLNNLAREGKLMPIIGRDKEIGRLIRILSRQTKNNPILVGEAGVGKTAVVEGLVQRIVRGDVPESIKNYEIYQVDIASIIAGSKVRGDVEQRLLVLVSEVSASPNKILFIDEIHMIIGAGATGADRTMDIANILKPRLTDGSIRVIGATTIGEYRQYFEEDPALSRRFQPILVDEISVDDAIEILKGIRYKLEEYHGVKITDDAIIAAAKLSDRYIADRFLPDKAIDVLDEAAAAEKLKQERSYEGYHEIKQKLLELGKKKNEALLQMDFDKAVGIRKMEEKLKEDLEKQSKARELSVKKGEFKVEQEDVKKIVAEWTGIPVATLTIGQIRALKDLSKRISKRIIGQEDAIKRVTDALKRSRMGISDETRPLASFLFLGPTGVGKTEMAKAIAQEFFGSEKSLIQIDMSEYMEQHSVSKIIGSPPGYVGYQQGGQLTEKIRKRPYSVVLFDEIEKAHPELLNIMLQIFEEGHINDSKGRKVNFKNTIVILTSNIGANEISKDKVLGFKLEEDSSRSQIDQAYERMRERLIDELKKSLRPEFINRIDEIVIFRGLDLKDAKGITKVLLEQLNKRLDERGIKIDADMSAIKYIATEGFSKEYGARNIIRKIQELVENPLSDLLIERGGKLGNVKITKKGNKLVLIPK